MCKFFRNMPERCKCPFKLSHVELDERMSLLLLKDVKHATRGTFNELPVDMRNDESRIVFPLSLSENFS